MTQKREPENDEKKELEIVYGAIEDYIFENHRFCSIKEISKVSGLNESKCRKHVSYLVKQGKLYEAFKSGKTNPIVYVPTYMMEAILRTQRKPDWVEDYSFEEKKEKLKLMENTRVEISRYEIFERLLYGTDKPLEEAVAYALKYLKFDDVEHHLDTDVQDVSFTYNGKKYLLEVEGTTRQGTKDKVSQLHGWIKKEVDKGTDPNKLVGMFVVNHFRNKDPKKRETPLTKHAKDYLKLYRFRFFTTYFLFNLIKRVQKGELTKQNAREMLIRGEKYE